MSGVISGAGSKSGVIGTTELDYEEGNFTPTNGGSGWSNSSSNNTYVKVGKMVTCYMNLQLSSGSASTMYVDSMPFASASNCEVTSTNGNSGTSLALPYHFVIGVSASRLTLYRTDNYTAPYADNMNGTHARFSITYKTTS